MLNREDVWVPHAELVEAIDLYMANHCQDGKLKIGAIGVQTKLNFRTHTNPPQSAQQRANNHIRSFDGSQTGSKTFVIGPTIICVIIVHLRRTHLL